MSIFSILGTCLGLSILLGTAYIAKVNLEQIAVQTQIDICAVKIATNKQALLEKLFRSNQSITVLQAIVYSSRGLKLVVPTSGIALSIGEKAALTSLNALVKYQSLLIELTRLKNWKSQYCEHTPYTKKPALCSSAKTSSTDFTRNTSLFPDVPGTLTKISPTEEKIQCTGLARSKILSSTLLFSSPFQLKKMDFHYLYQE